MPYKIKKNKSGFTFIEALVLLFVFSLITVTFYNVITTGIKYTLESKNRLGAVALANEKMEIIRNLKYEDIGTIGGVVSGSLPQIENTTQGGRAYKVETLVNYVDDSFDGTLGGDPNDLAYKDYKTVKLTISWNNNATDQGKVDLVSRFVSPGLETASYGDGILSINVFSDQLGGGPVPQASVHLVNSDVGINETLETDNTGNIMLVGAKESINRYQLTVSKSGYETVSTFMPYPDTAYNPFDVHASVIGGSLNRIDIVQNKLANIEISTVDYQNNPVAGINFKLSGGRKLGTEVVSPYNIVYNMNTTDVTNSSGEKNYDSISPGQYSFSLLPEEETYDLIGISNVSPFSLIADSTLSVVAKVARKDVTSLLVQVVKSTDRTPISGAKVKATNVGLAYDKEITTQSDGLAFFPVSSDPLLEAGIYDISVKTDGFNDFSGQADVQSGALLIMEASIEAN